MKAAFAYRDITPDRSMKMAGFDRRKEASQGTLDPLSVCALALVDDRGIPFVMCAFDLLGTDSCLCARVQEAVAAGLKIAPEQVWVCATHTHSAPTGHFSGSETYDENYVTLLTTQALSACLEALENARPAAASGGLAQVTGVASLRNRGRAGSEFPMPLPVVFLDGPEQALTLARISCHPTVLDERNLLYSRDLPGQLRDGLASRGPCLVLNGPCADLSTRFTRLASDPAELTMLGRKLTDGVQNTQTKPLPRFGAEIKTAQREIHLSRSASLSGELRDSILTALRQKAAECTDPQAFREYDSRIAVLERSAAAAEKNRKIRIGAVNLGGWILVGVPFEVDYADGQALEQTLSRTAGQPVSVVCYAFGYDGYLPSGAPLSEDSSYEDIASRYLPESRAQVWECAKQCVMEVL